MLFLLFVWGLFGGSVGVVFTLKALVLVIMQYLASCITAKFKKNLKIREITRSYMDKHFMDADFENSTDHNPFRSSRVRIHIMI